MKFVNCPEECVTAIHDDLVPGRLSDQAAWPAQPTNVGGKSAPL